MWKNLEVEYFPDALCISVHYVKLNKPLHFILLPNMLNSLQDNILALHIEG